MPSWLAYYIRIKVKHLLYSADLMDKNWVITRIIKTPGHGPEPGFLLLGDKGTLMIIFKTKIGTREKPVKLASSGLPHLS